MTCSGFAVQPKASCWRKTRLSASRRPSGCSPYYAGTCAGTPAICVPAWRRRSHFSACWESASRRVTTLPARHWQLGSSVRCSLLQTTMPAVRAGQRSRTLCRRSPKARPLRSYPDLGDGSKSSGGDYDHQRYTAALRAQRQVAAATVLAEHGWSGVLELAARASQAWALGEAVADADGGACLEMSLGLLAAEQTHELHLGCGYVARRFRVDGWPWLDQQLARPGMSIQQLARLLLVTGDHPRSWRCADQLGDGVASAFWEGFSPIGLGPKYPHVEETAQRLLTVNHPDKAIELLRIYAVHQPDADPRLAPIALEAMEALLEQPGELPLRLHHMQSTIDFLERHRGHVDVDRLARLEWRVLPALGYHPRVPSLHAALTEDPAFFVEVLSLAYRRRSEPETSVSEQQRERATNAQQLLLSWSRPPGTGGDGTFDAASLRTWVHTTLALLDAADRRAPGQEHIGRVLAFAPADPDGTWPCLGVRELLEDLELEPLERALARQLYNNRGVISRRGDEGGDGERALAHRYRDAARHLSDGWSRAAAILRFHAETLEHDARRYDTDAELRRQGLDL